jgi:DNA-binding IscR family transcriptional regulator
MACPIAAAFLAAEAAWRRALASVTLAAINATASVEAFDDVRRRKFREWLATVLR